MRARQRGQQVGVAEGHQRRAGRGRAVGPRSLGRPGMGRAAAGLAGRPRRARLLDEAAEGGRKAARPPHARTRRRVRAHHDRIVPAPRVEERVVHRPRRPRVHARSGESSHEGPQGAVEGPPGQHAGRPGVRDAQHRGAGRHRHGPVLVADQGERRGGDRVGEGPMRGGPHRGRDPRRIHPAAQVQTQPRLRFEQQPHRAVDALAGQAPRFDRLGHRVHRDADPGRRQQHVRARLERRHVRLARAVAVGDRAHDEGVGEEEAAEAEVAAQDVGHELGGHRRRAVVAEHVGHGHVRGHDGVHPRVDRHAEGEELHPVEARAVRRDHRKDVVRVAPRVAVAGEVLRRRERAARPRAPNEGRAKAPDLLRVFAERAGGDHGVPRIAVDVDHGREEPVDAQRPRLRRRDPPVLEGEALVAGRPERHGRREVGAASLGQHPRVRVAVDDPHARSAVLEVRRDQERDERAGLEAVQLGDVGVRHPDRDDDAAQTLLGPARDLLELGVVVGLVAPRDPGNDELGGGLPQREAGQGGLDPAPGVVVQGRGADGRGRGREGSRRGAGRGSGRSARGGQRDQCGSAEAGGPAHHRPGSRAGICRPAPIPWSPIRVGTRPVTSIRPRIAATAARSATGTPDHAVRYVPTSGNSDSR